MICMHICRGCIYLAQALKSNNTLKYVNIECNMIGDYAVYALSKSILYNAQLIDLNYHKPLLRYNENLSIYKTLLRNEECHIPPLSSNNPLRTRRLPSFLLSSSSIIEDDSLLIDHFGSELILYYKQFRIGQPPLNLQQPLYDRFHSLSLNFHHNLLSELPDLLFHPSITTKKVTSLCLSENMLLPQSFQHYCNLHLKELDLSSNQLSHIPISLSSQLPNLQILNLQNNQISDLPHSLTSLSSLRVLNLANNYISLLPSSFFTSHHHHNEDNNNIIVISDDDDDNNTHSTSNHQTIIFPVLRRIILIGNPMHSVKQLIYQNYFSQSTLLILPLLLPLQSQSLPIPISKAVPPPY